MRTQWTTFGIAAAVGLALSTTSLARPTDNPEIEPNDSKSTATLADSGGPGMAPGDTITCTTTGTTTSTVTPGLLDSADYFRIKTVAAPPGVYRYRLLPTTPSAATGYGLTIRGLEQVSGVIDTASDVFFQVPVPGTILLQWYGFGKQEEVYYRVTGSVGTTTPYLTTLSRDPVIIIDGPMSLNAGSIRITTMGQGHTTDTSFWIYDSDFNAIPNYGNEDESLTPLPDGSTYQSNLVRNFGAGTYYMAISDWRTANNQPAPADDDAVNDNFGQMKVLDFPNVIANKSSSTNLNCSTAFIDSAGSHAVTLTKVGAYDVVFVKFVVVAPATQLCCRGATCATVAAGNCPINGSIPGVGSVVALGTACTFNTYAGCCNADFDKNGVSDVNDIFAYLNAWFSLSIYADVSNNGAGAPVVNDIFGWLNQWFAGCS